MSLGSGFAEAVWVEMDGKWQSTMPPNWLVTEGVASCIAVAIACDASTKAWLVHASNFSHDESKLREMLSDAASVAPLGNGLQVWVLGGVPADGCEIEANQDRTAVQRLISEIVPDAHSSYEWLELERVELICEKGEWCCVRSENT
jgi:hypothetical protein